MLRLLSLLLILVQVKLLFDPNGDGVSDGLMWNTPVVAYLNGDPVAYATTGRDSSVHLELEPGFYRFRAWVKNGPALAHSYLLCQKATEVDMQTHTIAVSCRYRYLRFMPMIGGRP